MVHKKPLGKKRKSYSRAQNLERQTFANARQGLRLLSRSGPSISGNHSYENAKWLRPEALRPKLAGQRSDIEPEYQAYQKVTQFCSQKMGFSWKPIRPNCGQIWTSIIRPKGREQNVSVNPKYDRPIPNLPPREPNRQRRMHHLFSRTRCAQICKQIKTTVLEWFTNTK